MLLSAAFDKSAVLVDIRSPTEVLRWKLSADVEKVEWNSFHPQEFFVSTEDGFVTCYDSLSPKNTAFTLQAHTGAVGGLSINKKVPNCLATASDDKSLKVWDFTDHKPSLVYSNDSMNVCNFLYYFYSRLIFFLVDPTIYVILGERQCHNSCSWRKGSHTGCGSRENRIVHIPFWHK